MPALGIPTTESLVLVTHMLMSWDTPVPRKMSVVSHKW